MTSDSVNALASSALLKSEALLEGMKRAGAEDFVATIHGAHSGQHQLETSCFHWASIQQRLLNMTLSTANASTLSNQSPLGSTDANAALLRSQVLVDGLKDLGLTQSEIESFVLTHVDDEDVAATFGGSHNMQHQVGTYLLRWAVIQQQLLDTSLSTASGSTMSTQTPLGSIGSENYLALLEHLKDLGLAESTMTPVSIKALAETAFFKGQVLLGGLRDLGVAKSEIGSLVLTPVDIQDVIVALGEPGDRQRQLEMVSLRWAVREQLLNTTMSATSGSAVSTPRPLAGSTISEGCLSHEIPRPFCWRSVCGDSRTCFSEFGESSIEASSLHTDVKYCPAGGTLQEKGLRVLSSDDRGFFWASVAMHTFGP